MAPFWVMPSLLSAPVSLTKSISGPAGAVRSADTGREAVVEALPARSVATAVIALVAARGTSFAMKLAAHTPPVAVTTLVTDPQVTVTLLPDSAVPLTAIPALFSAMFTTSLPATVLIVGTAGALKSITTSPAVAVTLLVLPAPSVWRTRTVPAG